MTEKCICNNIASIYCKNKMCAKCCKDTECSRHGYLYCNTNTNIFESDVDIDYDQNILDQLKILLSDTSSSLSKDVINIIVDDYVDDRPECINCGYYDDVSEISRCEYCEKYICTECYKFCSNRFNTAIEYYCSNECYEEMKNIEKEIFEDNDIDNIDNTDDNSLYETDSMNDTDSNTD